MIRLITERARCWKFIKKYGNPHKHPLWMIMLCSIPLKLEDGYVYFFQYENNEMHLHSALKSLTKGKAQRTLDFAKRLGAKRICVYYDEERPTVNRICEFYGASLNDGIYTLEL